LFSCPLKRLIAHVSINDLIAFSRLKGMWSGKTSLLVGAFRINLLSLSLIPVFIKKGEIWLSKIGLKTFKGS
jgi:hypothetical protein